MDYTDRGVCGARIGRFNIVKPLLGYQNCHDRRRNYDGYRSPRRTVESACAEAQAGCRSRPLECQERRRKC